MDDRHLRSAARHALLADRQSRARIYDGDDRLGDNLYSDSIVALDAKTGTLKWHFQFTPHDVWDWDAQQPPVLVDATWQGQPRKLLLQANRNGFFYVLDRTNGAFLLGQAVREEADLGDAASAPDGRPVLNARSGADADGTRVCPAVDGASNWFSTSFNPATGLYYVQTHEKCGIFTRTPEEWRAGKGFTGGSTQARGRAGAEGPARDRHPDRRDRVGAAADRPRRSRGAARWRPPAASCSSAKTAAR